MNGMHIGEVSTLLGISADTLRYYEKIQLVPTIARTGAGIRVYVERDLSRLRFIKRAQKMQFSLREIAALLKMREDPQHARDEVRLLTGNKLDEIEERLQDLQVLRNELRLLLNLCSASKDGCPIIERIDSKEC
ncbi:MAG: MerR family transcriptional regulator [Gammaproteobacteria bacterium]|nr:MerR family transcriptional regulator [Gammaproteobacteria bacterium]